MRYAIAAAALLGLASPAWPRGSGLAKMDADHDGVVTRAEFAAHRDAMFDRLDQNRDGLVSPADFPRLARFRPAGYQRITAALQQADRNGDGAVSRAELAAAPMTLFDRADSNRDGRIDTMEADAAKARVKAAASERKQ